MRDWKKRISSLIDTHKAASGRELLENGIRLIMDKYDRVDFYRVISFKILSLNWQFVVKNEQGKLRFSVIASVSNIHYSFHKIGQCH